MLTLRHNRLKRNYIKKESRVKLKEFISALRRIDLSNSILFLDISLIEIPSWETSSLPDMVRKESCLFSGLNKICLFLTMEFVQT